MRSSCRTRKLGQPAAAAEEAPRPSASAASSAAHASAPARPRPLPRRCSESRLNLVRRGRSGSISSIPGETNRGRRPDGSVLSTIPVERTATTTACVACGRQMPEPVKRNQRYMPGLDGLRAIAVLAVIAFHLGFGWAPGGLLGVGIFFTLSGYLITDILLSQLVAPRPHPARPFWLARARRLLPALFAMLVIVVAWVTIFGPAQPQQFRDGGRRLGSLRQQLAADLRRRLLLRPLRPARPAQPPLVAGDRGAVLHRLAVPAADRGQARARDAAAPPGCGRGWPSRPWRWRCVSAILMAVLYHPSLDPSRVYYGTDTRAFELLFGAALAMVWPSRKLSPRIAAGARNTLDGLGVAGLVVIALMIWQTDQYSSFLYRGGFVAALDRDGAGAVAALAHPASRLGADARLEAAALDRRALLRHLPLALPGDRPHHPRRRRQRRRTAARAAAVRGDRRHLGALLEVTSRSRSATARSAASGSGRGRGSGGRRTFSPRGLGASPASAPSSSSPPAPAWPASTRSRPKAKTCGSKKRSPPAPRSRRR